jgi:hypothetical protein
MCRAMLSETRPRLSICLPLLSIRLPQPVCLKVRMSGEPSELEKSVEEVLKKLMDDRPISEGVQHRRLGDYRLPLRLDVVLAMLTP